jgi:alkyl hydroperoxide reductase subunit F
VFPAEAETRGIRAVPTTLRDGEIVSSGRSSFDELLARLDVAAAAIDETVDVAVVGGGPAGASAAIYAARKGIKTALVAERFGGQVGDTLGIENLVSVAYTEGPKLVAEMERHVAQYGVRLVTGRRVVALRTASDGGLHELHLDGGGVVRARAVVLAPGARWRELGVPGEREHRTKGVTFCPHCDGPLFKGKDVAVVGGGNSGVEAAIDLAGLARRVTLLEFDDRLRADAVLQDRLRALPNVDVRCNARTTEVLGDGTRVSGLRVQDRATGELGDVGVDGVFVQIGLTPGTDWLRGAVALNPRGEIEVDAAGRTSVPGVFAAGDATTAPYKQIVVAMGDGAKAALSAFDWLIRHPVAAAA